MESNLREINELLGNLRNLRHNPKLKFIEKVDVNTSISDDSYGDGRMGEEDTYYEIYEIVGENDLFLKVNWYTDSYGGNEAIEGIEFVKPKETRVTDYEKI